MRTRKIGMWIACCACLVFGFRLMAIEQDGNSGRKDPQLPGLMLAKLANTQRIVAGLVSKNYGEIKRGAEDMLRVCDAEQWETNPDPVYSQHKGELRRQAAKLIDMTEAQNLDGAAFVYIQTISTCISCHEHCRDVLRIAQIPNANRVITIPATEQDSAWSGMPILRR